jgi:hypothetical protein
VNPPGFEVRGHGQLPAGWQYRVRRLDADYVVRALGARAYVIQDDFENTYQRADYWETK